MNFKDAFKFPLKDDFGIVFTADNKRVFDFAGKYNYPLGLHINIKAKNKIIKLINGKKADLNTDLKLTYNPLDVMIYSELNGRKQAFISIRGWGHLTGTGGLSLSDDVAAKIQDDLAQYIVDQLNPLTPIP